MKRFLAGVTVFAMALSAMVMPYVVTAATGTDSGSVIDYIKRETFSADAALVQDANGNDQYGLYSFYDGGANLTSEYLAVSNDGDMEAYQPSTTANQPTLYFSIPVSDQKVVLDYRVYAQNALKYTYCDLYTRTGAEDTTGTQICRAFTNNTNSKYYYDFRLILNPADNTITGTRIVTASDGTVTSSEVSATFTPSNGYAYFMFKTSPARTDGGTNVNLHFDYINVYELDDTVDFTILNYTTDETANTTEVTLQFDAPVTDATMAAMTLNGVAATSYTDDSDVDDESNVYTLTFATALANGTHTVATADGAATLDGTAVDAEQNIKITQVLTKRITNKAGTTMYGIGNIFGATPYTSGTTATMTVENESLVFTQNSLDARGSLRTRTTDLGARATTEKLIIEFDAVSSRSVNKIAMRYGNEWASSTYTTLTTNVDIDPAGKTHHYQVILDFTAVDTEGASSPVYSLYHTVNGEKTALKTGVALSNPTSPEFYLNISDICADDDSGKLGVVTVKNFSMYTPVVEGMVGQVAETGNVEFSLPLDTAASTATANGTSVGLVRMPETAENIINQYQIDTSSLEAGTYDVTINPVAADGTVGTPISYSLTVTGEPYTFSDLQITPDGTNMKATVKALNNRTGDKKFTMILCQYELVNGIPMLKNANAETKTVSPGTTPTEASITLTPDGAGSLYKAFVWDSLNGMVPQTDEIAYPAAE